MKPGALLVVAIGTAALLAVASGVEARRADETGIRQALQYYFDGGRTRDTTLLRRAFHPEARMLFARDGKLAIVPIDQYIRRVGEGPTPAGTDSVRRRIASVDVAGDAAIARLEQERPGMLITDYMSLLRVDGHWRIVNKSFSRQERGRDVP